MEFILEWFEELVKGFSTASSWLYKPLFNLDGQVFYPLLLLTFTGLTVYIGVAFVKWVVS